MQRGSFLSPYSSLILIEETDPRENRLLMSNEPAVFGLAELWVANATRSDDTFSQLGLDEDVFADDDEESQIGLDDPDFFTYGGSPTGSPGVDGEDRGRSSILTQTSREQLRSRSRGTELGTLVPKKRRASVASTIPTIFANTGLDPSSLGILSPAVEHADSTYNPLEAIPEGVVGSVVRVSTPKEDGEGKSLIWQYVFLSLSFLVALLIKLFERMFVLGCRWAC